eukprot:gene30867-35911_t
MARGGPARGAQPGGEAWPQGSQPGGAWPEGAQPGEAWPEMLDEFKKQLNEVILQLKSSNNDPRGFIIKVSDFGLSRVEDDETSASFPFNSCGTAAYVAPEALIC